MSKEKWEDEITDLKEKLLVNSFKHTYHGGWYDADRSQRNILKREQNSLKSRIRTRKNKIAALDGPPIHKDVFGQVFKIGQRVAWSSSSKYAGATLGWVVGITHKMVKVSGLKSWKADSYGSALMPKALIICDAIVESMHCEAILEDMEKEL